MNNFVGLISKEDDGEISVWIGEFSKEERAVLDKIAENHINDGSSERGKPSQINLGEIFA